jgi:hypothetical protein
VPRTHGRRKRNGTVACDFKREALRVGTVDAVANTERCLDGVKALGDDAHVLCNYRGQLDNGSLVNGANSSSFGAQDGADGGKASPGDSIAWGLARAAGSGRAR